MSNPIVWNFPSEPTVRKEGNNKREIFKGGEMADPLQTFETQKIDSLEKVEEKHELMVVDQPSKAKPRKKKEEYYFIDFEREPMTTFCITPNNSPEMKYSSSDFRGRELRELEFSPFNNSRRNKEADTDLILNTINGLFQKFYAPERVRFAKNGIRVKMNDLVSYKIAIEEGLIKFYLSVPTRWKKNFSSAIRQDWGQVDITEVNHRVIEFDPKKTHAMEVYFRHHYALSLKHESSSSRGSKFSPTAMNNDTFLTAITSLASTLGKGDKILIDYNIEPTNNDWKSDATKVIQKFKKGKPPIRGRKLSIKSLLLRGWDVAQVIFEEFVVLTEDLMGALVNDDKKVENKETKQLFDLQYSEPKIHANTKGYKVQIRVLGQSEDPKKVKHAFKNIETAYSTFDGDNKYIVAHIKSSNGKQITKIVQAVEKNIPTMGRAADIYFEKELKEQIKLRHNHHLS